MGVTGDYWYGQFMNYPYNWCRSDCKNCLLFADIVNPCSLGN